MSALKQRDFRRIEWLIVQELMDGSVHHPDQLLQACMDDMSERTNLYVHITSIRKKLVGTGLQVHFVTAARGTRGYLMSRSIAKGE